MRAFAPATVANVAVGFDILGFAVPILGDTVEVEKTDHGVLIDGIMGKISFIDNIPLEAEKNTAGFALLSMIDDLNLDFGFNITIEKGIPLGSGLGGSAASAVAAVFAANKYLENPLDKSDLLKYAVLGESVASGMHADNVAPALYGGMTAVINVDNDIEIIQLPVPDTHVLLIHPDIVIKTKDARDVIKPDISLKDHVLQSMLLTRFISSLYTGDFVQIEDIVIEPQRAGLIPGFDEMKKIANDEGVKAFSISGAGPTVFAFGEESVLKNVQKRINVHESWICKIDTSGARIV